MSASRFDVDAYLSGVADSVQTMGDERVIDCPVVDCGKVKRFYVRSGGERNCHFYCFSCGVRGRTPVDLMCVVEGISQAEAMQRVLRSLTGRVHRTATTESLVEQLANLRAAPSAERDIVDVPLPREYRPLTMPSGKVIENAYTRQRGITPEAIARFKMGVCMKGRYFGRLILPFECPNGRSLTGRDMTGKSEVRYLNPKKEEGAEHARLLYGWPEGDEWEPGKELFIVEGPLDRVRMWQHGFPAIATLGKVLHDDKLEMIFDVLRPSGVVILLDPEERMGAITMATALATGVDRVWIARLPDGAHGEKKSDPGNSSFEQVRQAYVEAERFTGRRGFLLDALLESTRKSRTPA